MHLLARYFYSLLRERERERERKNTEGGNSWILGYHFKVESAIIFYEYNCLENKDKPFWYRMYIKGFFLDCKQKDHLKNTMGYMFMRFFLFFFEI